MDNFNQLVHDGASIHVRRCTGAMLNGTNLVVPLVVPPQHPKFSSQQILMMMTARNLVAAVKGGGGNGNKEEAEDDDEPMDFASIDPADLLLS